MIEELTNYMNDSQPIDIILNTQVANVEPIVLRAFLVTRIYPKLYTFEGYTLEEREKPMHQRILFQESIYFIENISRPYE